MYLLLNKVIEQKDYSISFAENVPIVYIKDIDSTELKHQYVGNSKLDKEDVSNFVSFCSFPLPQFYRDFIKSIEVLCHTNLMDTIYFDIDNILDDELVIQLIRIGFKVKIVTT